MEVLEKDSARPRRPLPTPLRRGLAKVSKTVLIIVGAFENSCRQSMRRRTVHVADLRLVAKGYQLGGCCPAVRTMNDSKHEWKFVPSPYTQRYLLRV